MKRVFGIIAVLLVGAFFGYALAPVDEVDNLASISEILEPEEAEAEPVEEAEPEVEIQEEEVEPILPLEVETPIPAFEPEPEPKIEIQKPKAPSYMCNCSKTCGQMSSCQEARYQLYECGCSQRDGDGDQGPQGFGKQGAKQKVWQVRQLIIIIP